MARRERSLLASRLRKERRMMVKSIILENSKLKTQNAKPWAGAVFEGGGRA
jgi:hypothetical protein